MTDVNAQLKKAIRGLLYPSETDAKLQVFVWREEAPFTPEALLASAGLDATTPVETTDLATFMQPVTTPHDWDGPAEQKQERRFTALRALLEASLSDIKVYWVGKINIDVYVVGKTTDGTYTGVKTKMVET